MPRMTIFERWDVVVAAFPFTDIAVRKPRPIVVLSSEGFNRDHMHFVGCMMTTAAQSRWPSDHAIADLGEAGLAHASTVRWKLFTLPLDLVTRRVGRLSARDRGYVAARTAEVLVA